MISGRLTSPCAATTPPRTIAVSPGATRPTKAPVSRNARPATSAYVHAPSDSARRVSAPSTSGGCTAPVSIRTSAAAAAGPAASMAARARGEVGTAWLMHPVSGPVGSRTARLARGRRCGLHQLVDQVRDGVDDAGGAVGEALRLLATRHAGEHEDGGEARLQPRDHIGVHPVADHRGGLRVGVDRVES